MKKYSVDYSDHDYFDDESNANSTYDKGEDFPVNYHHSLEKFDNSMAHMRRIYIYFEGNSKGCQNWLNLVEDSFPEAKKVDEKNKAIWQLNSDKIWALILNNEKWKLRIERQKISCYAELTELVLDAQVRF